VHAGDTASAVVRPENTVLLVPAVDSLATVAEAGTPYDMLAPDGTPLLEDALIAFDCCVVNEIHSGTHTIFIGQVTHIRAHDGQPLLYHNGAFTTTDPSPSPG